MKQQRCSFRRFHPLLFAPAAAAAAGACLRVRPCMCAFIGGEMSACPDHTSPQPHALSPLASTSSAARKYPCDAPPTPPSCFYLPSSDDRRCRTLLRRSLCECSMQEHVSTTTPSCRNFKPALAQEHHTYRCTSASLRPHRALARTPCTCHVPSPHTT